MVDVAQPLIATVVERFSRTEWNFRREDADDVNATVTLRTLTRLQALLDGEAEPIASFPQFVATLASNATTDVVRRRHPEMTRLRRRLRRLLTRDSRFALWTAAAGTVCGRSGWRGREPMPLTVTAASATAAMCIPGHPGASLEAIFAAAAGPASFDELARLLSQLWSICDVVVVDLDASFPAEAVPSPLEQVESRRFLEALWVQVQALRPAQRAALLLNLRAPDGSNALALLVILGIASLDAIAEALGISAGRLAVLWNGLPLDDAAIALLLGVRRQQVINLRRAARERLNRKLPRR